MNIRLKSARILALASLFIPVFAQAYNAQDCRADDEKCKLYCEEGTGSEEKCDIYFDGFNTAAELAFNLCTVVESTLEPNSSSGLIMMPEEYQAPDSAKQP